MKSGSGEAAETVSDADSPRVVENLAFGVNDGDY